MVDSSSSSADQQSRPGASADGKPDGKLKVFISYSRRDSAFADELLTGLEIAGFEAFLDTHDIAPGEPWEDRLGRLIAAADTVVFVISPNSVASQHCQWEVARCEDQGKRLLPIVWKPVEEGKVPDRLKRLNYVYFDKDHSFAPALASLAVALRTDLGWVREHTRLLARADEWQTAGKPGNRLLSGKDITDAKAWLAKTGAAQHLKPTELHRDFIQASEQAEVLHLSAERQRADELQTSVRRTRFALAGTAVFLLLALGAAGSAYLSQLAERQQRAVAEREQAAAEAARAKLGVKLAELERSEKALTKYIAKTTPKLSDHEIVGHIGQEAINLILRYEIGAKEEYEKRYRRPVVPGGDSGVTIGIGYDLGYYTPDEIAADWSELPKADLIRLLVAAGLKGEAARAFLPQVADVEVPFDVAQRQFQNKTLSKFGRQTLLVFPGSMDLPPDAFGALVSIVFNRGASVVGERRDEMRAMRSLLILGDYKGVVEQIRQMKRLWAGQSIAKPLTERREAEAQLFESGVSPKAVTK